MKIAFVSTIHGWGGSELLWQKVATVAAERGHRIYASIAGVPGISDHTAEMERFGAIVRKRPEPSKSRLERVFNRGVSRYLPVQPFRDLIRFAPDVIVISGDDFGVLSMPGLVAAIHTCRCPYLHVAHGCGGLLNEILLEKARGYFTRAYKVCFVAMRSLRTSERHLALTLENACIVRNPVNLQHDFRNHGLPWFDSPVPQLATVGRLNCYTKGQDLLLQSLADPSAKSLSWNLSIVGGGEHREYLSRLISYYGLSDRVTLAGHTSDITHVWSGFHLHVLPSLTESAPISLVEAMLCARPSLVTNVGGVREWLTDDIDGYLAENANPEYFTAAFVRAINGFDGWRSIGEKARERAIRLMGNPIEQFLSLINRCVEQPDNSQLDQ